MRHLLADFAHARGWANLHLSLRAKTLPERRRYLARSHFWSDVEDWLLGLGSWQALRSQGVHANTKETPE